MNLCFHEIFCKCKVTKPKKTGVHLTKTKHYSGNSAVSSYLAQHFLLEIQHLRSTLMWKKFQKEDRPSHPSIFVAMVI